MLVEIWLRKKCVAVKLPSVMKSSSRLQIINEELSWKTVSNGNQNVKAIFKSVVNGNA